MLGDVRYAFRTMRRAPATTAVALFSIAIGTGAEAVVFAAVKSVLIEPLPYKDAGRLVQIRTDATQGNSHQDWVAWSDMQDVARGNASLEGAGIYHYSVQNLEGDSSSMPEALFGVNVSASLFPVLGVKPMLGRNILPEEDQPKHATVVILSYGLWARRFNSDRGVLGRPVQMNGRAATIIGVMPPEFNFPMRMATTVRTPAPYTEFWAAPLPLNPAAATTHEDYGYAAVARLREGVTTAQASQDLGRVSAEIAREFPVSHRGRSLRALPMVEQNLGASRTGLGLLFGAAGLFMLIGCANVANLLLARGLGRQKEFAIRFAVGAGRGRIVRQLIAESCVLAILGGLGGYLLTLIAWRLLPAIAPMSIPRLASARADGWVFAFTVVISLLNGVLFGILPALRASDRDPNRALREASGHGGLPGAFMAAEAALAVILVVTGSLLASNLIRLLSIDPGFDANRVLASIIVAAGDRYPTPARRAALWSRIVEEVNRLPGVESAGTVDALPFSGENGGTEISTEGPQIGHAGVIAETDSVSTDYLPTMGTRLIEGRGFRDEDIRERRAVAILDELAARKLFPAGGAVGRRICVGCRVGQPEHWNDVVGVVESMHHAAIDESPIPAVYLASEAYQKAQFLVVRARHPDAALAQSIRRAVASADPNQPVLLSATMATLIGDSIADRRFLYVTLDYRSPGAAAGRGGRIRRSLAWDLETPPRDRHSHRGGRRAPRYSRVDFRARDEAGDAGRRGGNRIRDRGGAIASQLAYRTCRSGFRRIPVRGGAGDCGGLGGLSAAGAARYPDRSDDGFASGVRLKAALHPRAPAEKAPQLPAMLPYEGAELPRGDAVGVQAPIGLDAPQQIAAAPGTQAMALGGLPQKSERDQLDFAVPDLDADLAGVAAGAAAGGVAGAAGAVLP